jgi:hypothetical protein
MRSHKKSLWLSLGSRAQRSAQLIYSRGIRHARCVWTAFSTPGRCRYGDAQPAPASQCDHLAHDGSVPKPVVAALNGRCHGAGWVIALACDFRVARADALIGDIRSSKAIFAGQSVPLVLSRLIGQSRTMDLLMTGRVIDAVEAERYGIVARVRSPETYEQELQAFVGELAEGPTKSLSEKSFLGVARLQPSCPALPCIALSRRIRLLRAPWP